LVQERIAGAAMEMFASACVISRLDSDLQGIAQNGASAPANREAAQLFLRQSFHRICRVPRRADGQRRCGIAGDGESGAQ
jgi:hypothetical protein